MTFNDYQRMAMLTAIYPEIGRNLIYPTLGLAGEAGELSNKVKKLVRDEGYHSGQTAPTGARLEQLAAELGDVLWYVAALAAELGIGLEDVARANIGKLTGRQSAGTLGGSGDAR